MSFLTTDLAASVGELPRFGAPRDAGKASVAPPTTRSSLVAADDASARMAKQSAVHASIYQAISAQALTILRQLVDVLTVGNGPQAPADAVKSRAAG
jgi:hypothetical protein